MFNGQQRVKSRTDRERGREREGATIDGNSEKALQLEGRGKRNGGDGEPLNCQLAYSDISKREAGLAAEGREGGVSDKAAPKSRRG